MKNFFENLFALTGITSLAVMFLCLISTIFMIGLDMMSVNVIYDFGESLFKICGIGIISFGIFLISLVISVAIDKAYD